MPASLLLRLRSRLGDGTRGEMYEVVAGSDLVLLLISDAAQADNFDLAPEGAVDQIAGVRGWRDGGSQSAGRIAWRGLSIVARTEKTAVCSVDRTGGG